MTDQNPEQQPGQPPAGSGWTAPGGAPSSGPGMYPPAGSGRTAPGGAPPSGPGMYPPGGPGWTAPGGAPWSGPGTYPPAASTRSRRTPLIWCAVVVVASVLAGSVGYEIGLQHSRISSIVQNSEVALGGPCPVGVSQPDPSATSPAGAALLARVLPIPAGDTKATGGYQQGVLSLREYMNTLYTGEPTEQARLVARCFQTVVHREWNSPDGSSTSVWLSQFGTAAGARSYILAVEQGTAADPTYPDVFRIPGVTDGMGYGNPTLDKDGDGLTRVFGDVGNVAILIDVYVPARTDNSAGTSILQQQSSLLASGSP